MPHLRFWLLLSLLISAASTRAAISPVAMTGGTLADLPGTTYANFGEARMNSTGKITFAANLQLGVGGVSAASEKVLVLFDGTVDLLAQSGSGNVAGVAGASYALFQQYTLDDQGTVLVRATLMQGGSITPDNGLGYWRFSTEGVSELVLRAGTSAVPGITGTTFSGLGGVVDSSNNNAFVFGGRVTGGAGINSNNDNGIWHYQGNTGALVARESTSAPGIPGGIFANPFNAVVNDSGQIAFRGMAQDGAGITMSNRAAIWKYNEAGATGKLIARTGVGDVPGHSGDFAVFGDPVINNAGQIAFRATLASGEEGIWLYNSDLGSNFALGNAGDVAGVAGASFTTFSKPFLTETGQLLATASLTGGGVTVSNDSGLWLFNEDGGQLLAREGIGNTGIPGASFGVFEHFAPVGNEGVFIHATLQSSPGIVESSNDEGIWLLPFTGTPELIVRKGDTLAGRTIADLALTTEEYAEVPLAGIANAAGELVFHATFTNGDSGLFLYSASNVTEYAAADFNRDGYVDYDDLVVWQDAYGATNDGRSFLIWQRQYTGPDTLAEVQAVPEPGVSVLLAIALVIAQVRTRRSL